MFSDNCLAVKLTFTNAQVDNTGTVYAVFYAASFGVVEALATSVVTVPLLGLGMKTAGTQNAGVL